jgi:hypothetical protein
MSEVPPIESKRAPSHGWRRWLAGIVIGDLAISLYFAAAWFFRNAVAAGDPLVYPSLALVPAVGGLAASYIWRTLKPTVGATILNTLWLTLLALAVAVIAFSEGLICILIISPIFFFSALTGALLGRVMFKAYPSGLQLSILPLLIIMAIGEPFVRSSKESVITDELVINAPPAKVWEQVTSFPAIPARANCWLFRLGLPYPVATTAEGQFVNARRECIFSGNAVFKETIAEFETGKRLTFDIVESPRDPELLGHLSPRRGQFVLTANANGTTTLGGSTWYSLHVRPLWYFDLWTQHIFSAVHRRVMEDIRRRAESGG